MKVHIIGIGGTILHNLAIYLKIMGHEVSWSDAVIYEPAKSRLNKYGLLPDYEGYDPSKINKDIDMVVLGMAMFKDNPELIKSEELGLVIKSFPEFVYESSKNKKRLVVGWSHGKTTTTAMVMHVLQYQWLTFDRLVGSIVEWFETMVKVSDAPIIVIEWDEYPTNKINLLPKFLVYRHNIWVLNWISRDHVNIFDTREKYLDAFRKYVSQTPDDGKLYYNAEDPVVQKLIEEFNWQANLLAYHKHPFCVKDGIYYLIASDKEVPVQVIGEHNMINIMAAKMLCLEAGVDEEGFYKAIGSFKPALNRLNIIHNTAQYKVYRDFAHSPSKLYATTQAIRSTYPDKTIIAVYELHTYSALNKGFLSEYRWKFDFADHKIVYYNPAAAAHKKLPELNHEDVSRGFDDSSIKVVSDVQTLQESIISYGKENVILLLMSSWDFGGMSIEQFIS